MRAVTKSWRDGLLLPITNVADAAPFVERLGFCTWAPVSGVGFPNLAEAMGESAWSVMEQTWFWKDDVHLEKRTGGYQIRKREGERTQLNSDVEGGEVQRNVGDDNLLHEERLITKALISGANRLDLSIEDSNKRFTFDESELSVCLLDQLLTMLFEEASFFF